MREKNYYRMHVVQRKVGHGTEIAIIKTIQIYYNIK